MSWGHKAEEEVGEVYRFRWLASLTRDLKHTLRGLRKSPGFSGVAVLILALGIGSNLAVFSLIDSLFLRPLPADRPGELVQISLLDRSGRDGSLVSTML